MSLQLNDDNEEQLHDDDGQVLEFIDDEVLQLNDDDDNVHVFDAVNNIQYLIFVFLYM